MPDPEAERLIDAELVRALLAESSNLELRDIAENGTIEPVANGWDNALFRVGPKYLARLPRRALAVPLIENEQRWLTDLITTSKVAIAVPLPKYKGQPSELFDWPWSVVDWFDGIPLGQAIAAGIDNDASQRLGLDLANFLAAFHREASNDAPVSAFRGMPLRDRHDQTAAILPNLNPFLTNDDIATLEQVWEWASKAKPRSGPPLWIHGDLHPWNLLWHENNLKAVIDFGDMTPGDPATDLAIAWWIFDHPQREHFTKQAIDAGISVDEATFTRACGWALSISSMVTTNGTPSTSLHRAALATLKRIINAGNTRQLPGF